MSFSTNDTLYIVKNGLLGALLSYLATYGITELLKTEPLCYYNPFETYNSYKLVKNVNTKFDDIVGCDDIKNDIKKTLDIIENGGKLNRSKGFIFHGASGTGKTMMARAIAGETKLPFIQIINSHGYMSRNFITTVKGIIYRYSPCVILFDEGSSVCSSYASDLLAELDGIESIKNTIFIITMSQDQFYGLDPAMKRSGRIDRVVKFNKPNADELKTLFMINIPSLSDREIDNLIIELPDLVQADIISIKERINIDKPDDIYHYIMNNVMNIIVGKETNQKSLNKNTISRICYHELGHMLVGLLVKDGHKSSNVPILNFDMVGGYTQMNKSEGLFTLPESLGKIATYLAGGVFEKHYTGHVSTGIVGDIGIIENICSNIKSAHLIDFYDCDYKNMNGKKDDIDDKNSKDSIYDTQFLVNRSIKILTPFIETIINENKDAIDELYIRLMKNKTLLVRDTLDIIPESLYNKYVIDIDIFLSS